jgi:hypothetical protein
MRYEWDLMGYDTDTYKLESYGMDDITTVSIPGTNIAVHNMSIIYTWHGCHKKAIAKNCYVYDWIGLRENLQETMVFTIKYGGFL